MSPGQDSNSEIVLSPGMHFHNACVELVLRSQSARVALKLRSIRSCYDGKAILRRPSNRFVFTKSAMSVQSVSSSKMGRGGVISRGFRQATQEINAAFAGPR